jgi:hypothetical protein
LRAAPPEGRGAASYVRRRFGKSVAEARDDGRGSVHAGDEDGTPAVQAPRTQVTEERACSIVSRNASPDIAFSQSVDPYPAASTAGHGGGSGAAAAAAWCATSTAANFRSVG